MQVAVQKYMKLQILPATGTDLQPLIQNGVTQEMRITNTMEGQKPLSIKIRVLYTLQNGQQVNETKVLNTMPTNY